MNQKNTFKKITILLIIIALTSTCTIVTASTTLPKNPYDPFDNYTISSTDTKIAYTEIYLRGINHNEIIEFGDILYFKNTLNLTNDEEYSSPIFHYIYRHERYLILNPNSKIILEMKNSEPIAIAESYTNRDQFSKYPGDILLQSNTNRNQENHKPNTEINAYLHEDTLFKQFYEKHPNEINSIKIYNPKYPEYNINPIFGQEKLTLYTTKFKNSQHYQKYITKNQNTLNYKETPTRETIIDYIFTQSENLLNNPYSKIYLNIKNQGWFLNREIIAYSRELTQDEIKKYHYPTNFTTQNTITQNLQKLQNNDILIAKTPGTDNQFGVFINIKSLKTLEPELENKFKWISTYNYNKDDSYWFTPSNGWFDTIYKP